MATRLFHPPEEVYPVELRGIMLIENTSRSVRRAPEVRNKKILFIGFISCEIPVIFPLSVLSDRENKGDVSKKK